MNGWIRLHRKLVGWGWYKDNCAKSLFLHLLMMASYEDSECCKAGQYKVSVISLCNELGFSRQQLRTAIAKLESTGEIIVETSSKKGDGTIFTITKYKEYQTTNDSTNAPTNAPTNETPSKHKEFERFATNAPTNAPTNTSTNGQDKEKVTQKEKENIKKNYLDDNAHAHEGFCDELKNSPQYLEVAAKQNGITKSKVLEYIDKFQAHLELGGTVHSDRQEYMRHFRDWLRITSKDATDRPNIQDKRRAAKITATSWEDYECDF